MGQGFGFGVTLNEAYQCMVESLRCVLIDIATDAATVEEFRREADDFFETDAPRAGRSGRPRASGSARAR